MPEKLILLPKQEYVTLPETDPLIYYYLPILGGLYRHRVEMALAECDGGERILEPGYGSGVTFINLAKKYREIYGVDLFADANAVTRMWNRHGLSPKLEQGNMLKLPYPDNYFDTVLLISILEHLKPAEQPIAMAEMRRVLKPGGQLVYGVPVERPLMVYIYKLMGYDIRQHHFSTEKQVQEAAEATFQSEGITQLRSLFGPVYCVGRFRKSS